MRDLQTVPAVTFDHFWLFFFLGWLFGSFFFFFFFLLLLLFSLVRSILGFLFIYLFTGSVFSSGFFFLIYIYISFGEFGYWKKKKKLYRLTGMGPQIVWKILSDGNWVMMPNRCEKLSDELWVMSDEWWVISNGNWVIKKVKPNSP